MRIAVASDDGQTIGSHFGRTKGFAIFEWDGQRLERLEYRPNTFTGHARGMPGGEHGSERHAAILDALADCQVVISHGMGRRLYDDLRQAQIQVCITEETDTETAMKLYCAGRLADRPDLACHHGHDA